MFSIQFDLKRVKFPGSTLNCNCGRWFGIYHFGKTKKHRVERIDIKFECVCIIKLKRFVKTKLFVYQKALI